MHLVGICKICSGGIIWSSCDWWLATCHLEHLTLEIHQIFDYFEGSSIWVLFLLISFVMVVVSHHYVSLPSKPFYDWICCLSRARRYMVIIFYLHFHLYLASVHARTIRKIKTVTYCIKVMIFILLSHFRLSLSKVKQHMCAIKRGISANR